MGVVIRNECGEVMASLSEKIAMPLSVEMLKMLAAIFVQGLGFKNVYFEGDAMRVVRSLSDKDNSNAFVGQLVKDLMSIVGLFHTYSISHVRRQGNNVAHALAREARMYFPEDVPPNVLFSITSDFPVE